MSEKIIETVNERNSVDSKTPSENDTKPESNPYAYLERDEFSSEKFKIAIKNLPKYYGFQELRKLVDEKLKLASNKIKFPRRNCPFAFVCFRSEEDKQNAMKVITGYKWKGKVLAACEAKPAPDPLVKRRNEDNGRKSKKIKSDPPLEEPLKASTIPLWNVAYDEQLKMKHAEMKKMLTKFGDVLANTNVLLQQHLNLQKSLERYPCELFDIRHSASIDEYRNKCEFSIGIDEETSLPTVGFRKGTYAKGQTGVGPIEDLRHIPQSMKAAVKVFQEFVRNSRLEVFNPELQTGHFRQLKVRHAPEQLMLVVEIHPQDLSEGQLKKFKEDLVEFFNGPGKDANVTSLYYQSRVKKTSDDDVKPAEHLWGETHLKESLLGLTFRISPEAFFQINTAGAEILYSLAIELAKPTEQSTVVDICCGTGTIGLCFAKRCGRVFGIEIIPEAVEDAKENAKINSIENCEFFAGKAEEILGSVLHRVRNDDVIAVVDPPRAGLHQKTIMQLRNSHKINKLVYVSCNPHTAMKNFIALGRPISKTMHGAPFVPVKAVPVDMFPHTRHCELIIYFERWHQEKIPLLSSKGDETAETKQS